MPPQHGTRADGESTSSFQSSLLALWDADVLGIVHARLDGEVLDANQAFLRTIGYTPVELVEGRIQWPQLAVPEQEPVMRAALVELGRDGRVAPRETEIFHRDGRRVPVLLGCARLPDRETECVAFVHDLTERKALEAQLLQAQRLESVGLLAGGIAHDLNNVLSVILLYGECAQGQLAADHPARADLDEIRRAAASAGNIARQLLAFSRQQVLQPRVLELGGVATGLETMLRRLLGEDIELVVRARASRHVMADYGQLEQVVLNLVVNARDAMPRGGQLSLDVEDLDIDGDGVAHGLPRGPYVTLRVTDAGTGMDEATLRRIFEPFFTTKEKTRGTGLGLSTVFGIVQQSGGAVWAESAPGRGSTFHVILPAATSRPRPRRATNSAALVAARGETILIVDDEAAIGRSLRRVLEKAGYRALVVSSPGDALLVAEQEGDRIDLLITDVVMPMMSGPVLSERLHATRPRLRTLFITGYAESVAAERGGAFEAVAILPKPFEGAALLAKVREVLDGDG